MTHHKMVLSLYRKGSLLLLGMIALVLCSPQLGSAQVFRYPESPKQSSLMPFFVENMSAVRITMSLFLSHWSRKINVVIPRGFLFLDAYS